MTTEMHPLTLAPARRAELVSGFQAAFSARPDRFFSAPGRTEIGGNHTDHQRGRVLAAAVNLDTVAAVRTNGRAKFVYSLQDIPCAQWIWTGWSQTPGRSTPPPLSSGALPPFCPTGLPGSRV